MLKLSFKMGDIVISCVVIVVVLMLIISLNTFFLDFVIVINISMAVIILLLAVNTKKALDFSTFPSLLLILTVFRLAINVNSTRLILINNGDAGRMVATFGSYVGGNNIVVGGVIFIILILVQFLVITKGAERVSEIAARFTLDAMPGKQMAIDADLNSGAIDEATARQRRVDVARESDFLKI